MEDSPQELSNLAPEAEDQAGSTVLEVGQLAVEEAVTVNSPKKRDFESVTFESFLHPIGW